MKVQPVFGILDSMMIAGTCASCRFRLFSFCGTFDIAEFRGNEYNNVVMVMLFLIEGIQMDINEWKTADELAAEWGLTSRRIQLL